MDKLLASVKASSLHTHLSQILCLVFLTLHLHQNILLVQWASHPPQIAPSILPPAIVVFLSQACDMSEEDVKTRGRVDGHVLASSQTIYPPIEQCHCSIAKQSGHKLHTAAVKQVILYTLNQGPLPAIEIHFTCQCIVTI